MPKFENTNPIKDLEKLEEDLNTPRSHYRICTRDRILKNAKVIEEPEPENLYDTGVIIPVPEKSSLSEEIYNIGLKAKHYVVKHL